MTFTDLFVRRPVLALVVSTLILLLGLFSLGKLPIRQYPLLESSTITVTTEYPGASADLMQGFVTQPIAQAVSSVEGIDYLSSTSVQGRSVVTIRMLLNRDSTQAMTETMAKVNSVRYKLPERAYDSVIERSSGETTAVAYVGFSSKTLPIPALTDYLSRVVEPMFSSIDGVAKVQTFGGQRLAMRLWLDADRLAGRGLTASDVAEAIRRNNYQAAPGMVKGQYVLSNVRVNTDLTNVDDFREMVIRNDGNGLVRLRDVGTVELGAAATETSALMDGDPAVHLGLFPTPTGNPLVIVDGIRKLLPEIQKTLPPDVRVDLAYETSRFIQASIDEVVRTLVEALLIVVLVIYLCLGSLRSVLIPVATIPLSMLGAAALMLAFGFSVNLLTLLAMVLAIGLVVDDAIVVVENVHRHIEEGKSPVAAALIGAREVAGPVIAMTITLAAVYTPIGLMGGLTGALFREFALTLAGAVIVSGVVALTLSPVMSSLLLQAHQNEGRMGRAAEWFFGGLTRRYGQVLEFSLGHRWLTGGLALLVCISLPLLYSMPKRELAPTEDQAAVLTAIKAPQHANLDYVELFARKLDQVYTSIPETVSTWIINGTDGPAASFGGINLAAWEKRERDASAIQSELQGKVGDVEGSSIFAFQLAALPGSTGGLPVQMVLRSPQDYPVLYRTMEEIKQKARQSGLFVVVDSDLDYNNPVVQVRIDRAKANSLGIRMQDIGESLAVLVGENYVNRFGMEGRSYDVIPQSLRDQRFTPQALARQFVRTQDGNLVPLSTVVRVALQVEPNKLIQFDQQNAATLQAIPAPGVSMGQAVAFLDDVARPAGRLQPRLAIRLAAIHPGRQHPGVRLPRRPGGDLPGARRAVREPGRPADHPDHRAAVDLRRAAAAGAGLRDDEHLYADRPGHPDRPDQQARHPHGRVRQRTATPRAPRPPRGDPARRADPPAAGADDHRGNGLRPGAAALRQRRRRRQPLRPGRGDRLRDAGRHPLHPVRAAHRLYPAGAQPRGSRQEPAQPATGRGRSAGEQGMKRSYPNLSRLALALAVGTGLAACSVGPDYQRPQSPPPRVASEHLGEFSGERREAPWWSFFDDPQLVRLVDQALARNHDIREARANLRSARALFDDRWLDQLPQVTSQAGYSRSIEQQLDYDGEPRRRLAESYRAGFDAQWEIDLFGRLGRLSDAALARAEAADADLRLVRLSIAADTARAYFEIQGYQRRLDVARAQVRSWRDTLELTRSSLQLGSGLPEDVENAQANLLRSEAAIPPLTTALESARYRLDVLRGEAPGSGAPILDGGAAAPLAKNLPLGDVDRLILQRPDVVSAERQLAASTEDVGAATAELYPRLDLGGFIGFFALRSGDLGSASRAFELAPSVSWPAFRLGNVRARLRAVEAQSDAALARYQRSLLLAQEDVGNALNQLAEHQRRLVALFQSATHGANALEIANERYRAGAGSYLAVLENQRALYQIREELAQAETASFVNVIALYKALGWGSGDLAPGAGQLAAGETAGANR